MVYKNNKNKKYILQSFGYEFSSTLQLIFEIDSKSLLRLKQHISTVIGRATQTTLNFRVKQCEKSREVELAIFTQWIIAPQVQCLNILSEAKPYCSFIIPGRISGFCEYVS